MENRKIILAIPKGRIYEELEPILEKVGIKPEEQFFDKKSRALRFTTNNKNIDIIRVRSFDVATFVAFGSAAIGIAGQDVIMEFDHEEIYAPLDLKIGKCRMSVAAIKELGSEKDFFKASHVKIATKYPEVTKKYFTNKGIQAECIKLNGAMELAPNLGMCRRIVDLVSTGSTLKANGLVEVEKIADISSYLIVNRNALKTNSKFINDIIEKFKQAING